MWASPHKPPYGAPLTQTSGGLQFRPCYRVKVGTSCTWGLTFTLLGWYAGQGGESGYTVNTECVRLVIERSQVRLPAGVLSSQLGQLSLPSLWGR